MEGMLSLILERGKEPSLYTLSRERNDKEKNGKGIWREKGQESGWKRRHPAAGKGDRETTIEVRACGARKGEVNIRY
jgi:hypothetical protein